jgi:glycosyltransferase involved in cell wall biosynthesis
MRLLFVHERYGAMAGAEVNAYVTAAELQARGHVLGILHGPRTGKSEEDWNAVFSRRFSVENREAARTVLPSVNEFRPDAVYVHKMADLGVISELVKSGKPLVRMVHDHDIYCMRSYKYHPVTRKVCARPASPFCMFPCGALVTRNRNGPWPFKWVSYISKKKEIALHQRFQRMIVATDYMKDELLRNGFDPERVEIHAPVPRNTVAPFQSSFSSRNVIIYAGQIIRGKGVDVLLRSLKDVRVNFECLILGEGNHKPYCQELCRKLDLNSKVVFKGYVPPGELQPYYAEASLAVMSSVWPEPFGAVGLEGMRYGLPVVAFDAGGIKEWLQDGVNGFLVPHMDRRQFSARIEQLLRNKSLAREMGNRGAKLVDEKYSFDNYIDGLESMFSRAIAENLSQTESLERA